MTALSSDNLQAISGEVQTPAYDRSAARAGFVHFGVGNFHRAHQCVYLDNLFNTGTDLDWGIVGATIRREDEAHQADLKSQDCLSTVTTVDEGVFQTQVIGSILDYLKPGDRAAIVDAMTRPEIRIVSLTITEGGYYMSGDTPDAAHPDLVRDTDDLANASTVFGLILSAIEKRRNAGTAPFTVLSCDNLPHNGNLTRKLIEGMAKRVSPELGAYVAEKIAFPNSMVDRITPATRPDQIALLKEKTGVEDKRPVFCEPFIQWVIEDTFPSGRPALEKVGVTFVSDVTPYELMKLRILNAGHATIAYPAALMGITYAHEAMRDPLVLAFFEEVENNYLLPASPEIEGVSRESYLATVTHRFANPAIQDTIRRLALDGSNRQPKFVLPAVREFLAAGRDVSGLAMVQALWCRYCYGALEDGSTVEPNDPNWDMLQEAARAAKSEPRRFLELKEIFGDLAMNETYVDLFSRHLSAIWEKGTVQAVTDYLAEKGKAPKA